MELLGAADGCWQLESAAEPGACDEAAADVAVLRRFVSLNLMAPIAPLRPGAVLPISV